MNVLGLVVGAAGLALGGAALVIALRTRALVRSIERKVFRRRAHEGRIDFVLEASQKLDVLAGKR